MGRSMETVIGACFVSVLLIISGAEVSASLCSDVDTTACDLFAKVEDVCFNSCLYSLCPRRCGQCPLECFECQSVSSPELCKNTTLCPNSNYSCIVTESFDATFHKSYRLGCAAPDVCTQIAGSTVGIVIGRREEASDSPVGVCCQSDVCNNSTSIAISSGPVKRAPVPTSDCVDISPAACQQLSNVMNDMCLNPCIASKCRRTCGNCVTCYGCSHVTKPEDCTNITSCLTGEKCYVLETLDTTGEHGYRLGCMNEQACGQFYTQVGNVFGKREKVELSVHGECCKGDLCNHHDVRPTPGSLTTPGSQTLSPTQAPTPSSSNFTPDPDCNYRGHCPRDYAYTDGKCFMILDDRVNYNDAKEICENECGRLAEELTIANIKDIATFVENNYDNPKPHYFYVGTHRDDYDNFVWDSSNKPVSYGHINTDDQHLCGTIDLWDPNTLHDVRCHHEYHPICEAKAINVGK